jgi:glyoxylase I family protein
MPTRTRFVLGTHHVAVICSDYERSKRFYVEALGLEVVPEVYREARRSHKLDLRSPDETQVELFSFPDRRPIPSRRSRIRHAGVRVRPRRGDRRAFGIDRNRGGR